jgi:mRNA interferase RelE/StbE
VNTAFKSSFVKDLKSIKSKRVLEAVAELIETVERADNLKAIPDLKKLNVKGNYYRVRLGEHRVGVTVGKGRITFVRCLDRKEIYRYFP